MNKIAKIKKALNKYNKTHSLYDRKSLYSVVNSFREKPRIKSPTELKVNQLEAIFYLIKNNIANYKNCKDEKYLLIAEDRADNGLNILFNRKVNFKYK